MIFFIFCVISYIYWLKNTQKVVLALKKLILTSKRRAEHLFVGQNTQKLYDLIDKKCQVTFNAKQVKNF